MDRGAWWATVHGVTKGQPRLKQLGTCAEALNAIDKKRLIRIGGLQVGGREAGLQFYNQRKSGEEKKTTFFLILE